MNDICKMIKLKVYVIINKGNENDMSDLRRKQMTISGTYVWTCQEAMAKGNMCWIKHY